MLLRIAAVFLHICAVLGNTEKTIFLGPANLEIPTQHPTLEDLHLDALSPQQWSLRTHIAAGFPTKILKTGLSTWMILYRLQEGQRYELRICWAATEPTSFTIDTYTLPTVFENPALITSLAKYSESRQHLPTRNEENVPGNHTHAFDATSSALFLHIQAAADYYTMNQTLMSDVPPVFVDIILDPYIFNAVPRSLLPTVAYITILAIGAWYLSRYINEWIGTIVQGNDSGKKNI